MYFGILVPQPKKNKKYVNSQREHKSMLSPRRKDKEQKKKLVRRKRQRPAGWAQTGQSQLKKILKEADEDSK